MASYKAVCIKQDEIISRTVGTKHEIVPGDLLKIIIIKGSDTSNCYIIKIYDRETKSFHKDLYQCSTTSIMKLDENIWSLVSELRQDTNITLNLGAPDNKAKVDFRIKHIGDVPDLGAGRFFVLQLIDNPNLTENLKLHIRSYKSDPSGFYTIRVDKLTEYLRVDESDAVKSVPFSQNNYQLPSTIDPSSNSGLLIPNSMITDEGTKIVVIDLNYRNRIKRSLNVIDQTIVDYDISEERSELIESNHNFENQEQNGMNEYARQAPIDFFKNNLIRSPPDNYFSSDLKPNQNIKDFYSPSNKTISNNERTNNSLAKSNTSNMSNANPEVGAVPEDVFVYINDNSDEVLFYCKEHNCNSFWFVDKTEPNNIYACPICQKYNCFICEVIHDNMTCDEYQQLKSSQAL